MAVTSANWRKSSYSGGNGGNCVEVGTGGHGSGVLIRDTTDRGGVVLRVRPEAWREFAAQLKTAK